MAESGLIVETFPVGPLACNCTLLADPSTKEAVVIDPGGDAAKILARVRKGGFTVRAALHTHAHIDHIGATAELKEGTKARILLHEGDRWLYDHVAEQAEWIGWEVPAIVSPDAYLAEGDEVKFGRFSLRAIHTPGHTPGSLCFHLAQEKGVVFTGDTLFAGGIGRTDLWGGSMEQILESLHRKLLALEDETRVVPGHGPASTIGRERRTNPFLEAD